MQNALIAILLMVCTVSCQVQDGNLESAKEMASDGGAQENDNFVSNPVSLARLDATMGRIFVAPTTATGSCYDYDATGSSINSWCSNCHHAGKDYCGSVNDNIVSVASGRVTYVSTAADGRSGSGDNRGFGRTVIIAHKLANQTNIYSLYAHLASIASDITVGKYITTGYVLGKKGSSGGGSNGVVHLHFEMKTSPVLGHSPDCVGVGCVGYVKNALLPVSTRGYYNPNSYLGRTEFYDLVLDGNLPTNLTKSGVKIPVKINSPFTEDCLIDIRLSLFDTNGNYLGDIQSFNNVAIRSGSNTVTFTKSSLSSPAGTYSLQLSYKPVNGTTWVSLPVWSSYANPVKATVK